MIPSFPLVCCGISYQGIIHNFIVTRAEWPLKTFLFSWSEKTIEKFELKAELGMVGQKNS